MATIPASGVEITALGQVRVLASPDLNAEVHLYADRDLPGVMRPYLVGEPLGQSLGTTVTGTDGAEYLKIESFYWKVITRVLGVVVNRGRDWRTSYIRLDERDQTWRVALPGGVGASEADAIAQFLRTYRETYMPLADWAGVPEPQKVEIFKNTKGETDFKLTFSGGKVVEWSSFKLATLSTKLNLLTLDAPTDQKLIGPKGGTTSDLGLYLAGGAVLVLLGVVIVFQYIRKRRNPS